MNDPLVIVISAPSGTGKTSVVNWLVETTLLPVSKVVTCTTRPSRENERDGVDYIFLSEKNFRAKQKAGAFLETSKAYGYEYGTLQEEVDKVIQQGKTPLLVVDIEGFKNIKRKRGNVIGIFLVPPSSEVLLARLRGRGTDDEAEICVRFKEAKFELGQKELYDIVIVVNEVEEAAQAVEQVIGPWLKEKR
ncbi:MAG: guanylate kinase [Chlamydiae bacterium RIFCSPHIGHO2_12_FULL_49_11]|nr:MAG: guanylate kinase [Chlamydiae bacterium RIFCSPHIGHO2_12_FULL_49_11]